MTGLRPGGSVLPSVSRLAENYEVSPIVIGAAVRELRPEGLVAGRTGDVISAIDEPGGEATGCLDS